MKWVYIGIAVIIIGLSLGIIFNEKIRLRAKKLWQFFSLYEKIWFFGIAVLSVIFAFLFPEEDVGGVNGGIIMTLYLLDTLFNISCELLISKQSKWNFIVSVFVEITEIAISLVLAERFATMAVTLFFWLPIDIISFISWKKHPDREKEEITEVRKLTGFQLALGIAVIVVWTVAVGHLLTVIDEKLGLLDIEGKLWDSPKKEIALCYLDACCSAVGIANGLFILFRFREQWIAWYVSTALETVMNILLGQWVLLVLKAGYLTNTTYGYIKWTKYIKGKEVQKKE